MLLGWGGGGGAVDRIGLFEIGWNWSCLPSCTEAQREEQRLVGVGSISQAMLPPVSGRLRLARAPLLYTTWERPVLATVLLNGALKRCFGSLSPLHFLAWLGFNLPNSVY